MYKIANVLVIGLVASWFPLIFILVGQWIEQTVPDSPTARHCFLGCILGAVILSLGIEIYDMGKEAATKELEPDE